MDIEAFELSLTEPEPPALPPLAEALWWDARGDWGRAHELAQDVEGPDGAWVHAYLHRREGDAANAAYWYHRAGRAVCTVPLDAERLSITRQLLVSGR